MLKPRLRGMRGCAAGVGKTDALAEGARINPAVNDVANPMNSRLSMD
jgi:hypothetical protein